MESHCHFAQYRSECPDSPLQAAPGEGQLPLRVPRPGQAWAPVCHLSPPLPLQRSNSGVSVATFGPEGGLSCLSRPSLSAHLKSTGAGLFIYLCIYF